MIYVLNRDNMGQFGSSCTAGDCVLFKCGGCARARLHSAQWCTRGPGVGAVRENGWLAVDTRNAHFKRNSNGILWVMNGKNMYALNAILLKRLYATSQAANGHD